MPAWDHEDLKNNVYKENLNDFPKRDVIKEQELNHLQFKLIQELNKLTYEDLQKLNNDNFIQEFKHIVSLKIRKQEKLDPNQVVSDLIKLSNRDQHKILKEILFWDDRKIKAYEEDFGYNMYGIVLREIKDKVLVGDLKLAIDRVTFKENYFDKID